MQLTKRRKNSIFTFVIRLGGVAQLVERLNGIQEVRGSTPLISTTYKKKRTRSLSGSFSFRGLCAAMPCRLRREPLRAGAAFMRVNSLTSLLRKRCLLRTPSSPPQLKKQTRFYRVLFLFGGSARRCRAACGVNPFGLTASEERSKRLHLRKSNAADIENKYRQSYAEVSTKFNT